jgi:hypothetical protein
VCFDNISVISWRSVLLVEETGENHGPAASHGQSLSHNLVSSTPRQSGIRTHNVVIDVKFSCLILIIIIIVIAGCMS